MVSASSLRTSSTSCKTCSIRAAVPPAAGSPRLGIFCTSAAPPAIANAGSQQWRARSRIAAVCAPLLLGGLRLYGTLRTRPGSRSRCGTLSCDPEGRLWVQPVALNATTFRWLGLSGPRERPLLPLRAAPILKPPALPGDIYCFMIKREEGRHCNKPRVGVLVASLPQPPFRNEGVREFDDNIPHKADLYMLSRCRGVHLR